MIHQPITAAPAPLVPIRYRASMNIGWARPIVREFVDREGDPMARLRCIDSLARNCGDHQITLEVI